MATCDVSGTCDPSITNFTVAAKLSGTFCP